MLAYFTADLIKLLISPKRLSGFIAAALIMVAATSVLGVLAG